MVAEAEVAVYREGAAWGGGLDCVSTMNDSGNTYSVLTYLEFWNAFLATSHWIVKLHHECSTKLIFLLSDSSFTPLS